MKTPRTSHKYHPEPRIIFDSYIVHMHSCATPNTVELLLLCRYAKIENMLTSRSTMIPNNRPIAARSQGSLGLYFMFKKGWYLVDDCTLQV